MQKISNYIYSNRVQVVSDTGFYPVEWKQVYQRTVKIYQGLDNVIEFDVKNAQQRRIDVSSLTMKMVIMDEMSQELATLDVTPIPATTGLASCVIPEQTIAGITPQFLSYSLYTINQDQTRTPMYGDAQYGAIGQIQVIAGAMPRILPQVEITSFNYSYDDSNPSQVVKTYLSGAADVNPLNDGISGQSFTVDFITDMLDANVYVQFTDSVVVNASAKWFTAEEFTIDPTTTRITKTYNEVADYSNNVCWFRIKYIPTQQNTGSFKKVILSR